MILLGFRWCRWGIVANSQGPFLVRAAVVSLARGGPLVRDTTFLRILYQSEPRSLFTGPRPWPLLLVKRGQSRCTPCSDRASSGSPCGDALSACSVPPCESH